MKGYAFATALLLALGGCGRVEADSAVAGSGSPEGPRQLLHDGDTIPFGISVWRDPEFRREYLIVRTSVGVSIVERDRRYEMNGDEQ